MSNEYTEDKKWLHQRKMTVIGFAWFDFLLGCQQGILATTAWVYIEQFVKTDYPKAIYALTLSASHISSIVISPLVGKVADKYRNVRILFFVGTTSKIIGNLVYIVYFSPWYLLVGMTFSGLANALASVVNAELARCYEKKELAPKVGLMGLARCAGLMVGPIVNLPFTSLDVHLGELRITWANACGIYMSVLYFTSYFITFFMIHNLSKEFDMKQYAVDNMELVGILDDTDVSNHQEMSVREVILKVFTHFDTCLIISLAFVESIIITTIHVCNPLLLIDVLKWSPVALSKFMVGSAISFFLPFMLLIYFKPSDKKIYMFAVIGTFSFVIMQLIVIMLKLHHQHLTLNVILVIMMCMLQASASINASAFQVGIYAKMVSSKYQSSADSVRFCARRLGSLAAVISGPFVFSRIEVVGSVYAGIMLVLTVLTISRRKTLSEPRVII